MLSGRDFRAQLVTQGQRELYDYWLQAAGSRCMPARSDIDPFKVPRLLPSVGLIDVADGLDEARFRLAGTRLHEIYGEEITGKRVDRVFAGACSDYWQEVHGWVVNRHAPLHGVVRGPAEGRDHIVLFWLRLPLSQDGQYVDRILCYDTTAPIEAVRPRAERPARPYPSQPQIWAGQRRASFG
ncbi:MAG: PAS domain-containing protein [Methyloceanibacter sp.]|jgi:hypothetical protein